MKVGKAILVIALAALASTAQATRIVSTYTQTGAGNSWDFHEGTGTSNSYFSFPGGADSAQSQIDPNHGAPILQSYVSRTSAADAVNGGRVDAWAALSYSVTISGPDGLVPIMVSAAGHVDGSAPIGQSTASFGVYGWNVTGADSGYFSVGGCAGTADWNDCNGATSFTFTDSLQVLANQPIFVSMNAQAGLLDSFNGSGSVTSWVDPTFAIDPAYASQYKIVYSSELDQPSNNVPEPGSLALLGLGALSLPARRRRKSS